MFMLRAFALIIVFFFATPQLNTPKEANIDTTLQHTADETRAFVAGICKESNFPIYGIIPQVLAHACDNLFEYFGAQLTDGIRDSECMHCMRPSASMG